MNKVKKIIALALCTVMTATLLAGCGASPASSTATPSSGASTAASGTASAPAGGPTMPELPNNTLSITVNGANFGTDAQTTEIQKLWQEKMEAYLGIKLDITWNYTAWADFRETEKVLIQTGDIGDVSAYSQNTYINEFGADGMVLNLMDYWDYMTYYPEYVEQTNGGKEFILTEDGASYYFMVGTNNPDNIMGAQSFTSFAYRFDLLKEHNLTPATTLDEFTKLCADLQALIDEGKIDAKYVMSNTDKNYAFYRGFVGIFHTWDTTYWNGSEWAFGPIEDNFREMLKYLSGLYESGYIDPEFSTDTADLCNEKALNNGMLIAPTLWSGAAGTWNRQKIDEKMEWGLGFLPKNDTYGTPWKWGSQQDGKFISSNVMGTIINAETKYPEWIVKMIDYQYSDEMVMLMNWGVEGDSFTTDADGKRVYNERFTTSEDQYSELAKYGITAGGGSRPGIQFSPLMFDANTAGQAPEPWWAADKGFYEGSYWIESDRIGGADSVAPYDRSPVTRLSDTESTARAEMTTACELYAKEQSLKFIVGEMDINDDAAWEAYVSGVKSQAADFDGILTTMNSKVVK